MTEGESNGLDAEGCAALAGQLGQQAANAGKAAHKAASQQEAFEQLAQLLDDLSTLMQAMSHTPDHGATGLQEPLDLIVKEVSNAEELAEELNSHSRFWAVVRCRTLIRQVQEGAREMGRGLMQLAVTGMQHQLAQQAMQLGKRLQMADFRVAKADEALADKLEEGLSESVSDNVFLQDLLQRVRRATRLEGDALNAAIADLQKDVVKDADERLQLQQAATLLENAAAIAPNNDVNHDFQRSRSSTLRAEEADEELDLPPPLKSFVCPITHQVMEDPVEIASGQTFERSAIEKWFSEGHRKCPTTAQELSTLDVKPNLALRQSIEEWRERNTTRQIQAMRPKLASSREEDVESGLQEIFRLCQERAVNRFWVASQGLIPLVVGVLKSGSRNLRRKALATLTNLAFQNDENKEAMVEAGAITLAVRSLSRDAGESRQAVALLLELSRSERVCEDIGRAQGAILLLVTQLSSDNASAARDAAAVLEQLSGSDANVVQMAEANHFKPLAQRLISGSDAARSVMASALSRMALTEQSRASLSAEGALAPLVAMVTSGKLDGKAAALGALQNLSSLPANRMPLIQAGVLVPLLQLLFSVTSVVATLKEGAAATIANLAMAATHPEGRTEGSSTLLESEETVYQLLSLLSLSGPIIQVYLLRTLQGLAQTPGAVEVRNRMRGGGAITVLLPFLETQDEAVRTAAAQVLEALAGDGAGHEVAGALLEGQAPGLRALAAMLSQGNESPERTAAAAFIGALPADDVAITRAFMQANTLGLIVGMLNMRTAKGAARDAMLESSTAALIRFTLPSHPRLQSSVAEAGAIPFLVTVLETSTSRAKRNAAICLGNLAESSVGLSIPAKPKGGGCCFSPQTVPSCPVHGGQCEGQQTYCLLEADAVAPLVAAVGDRDPNTVEAALMALSTLLTDQCRWENGLRTIHQSGGFMAVVQQLTEGTERGKERAVWMLEKMFRIDEYKFEYGAKAQGALIELTQHGSNETRPVAAKILSHLEILHNQSSYF